MNFSGAIPVICACTVEPRMAVAEHNAPDVHPLLLLSYDHPHFYILNSFNHRTKNKDEQGLFIYLLHIRLTGTSKVRFRNLFRVS